MSSALRLAIVGIMLISFTACTTLQPLQDFTPSKIREQVHVGDRVSIVWRSGARYDIKVTAVDADALHGVTDAGKAYKFLFEGIRSIEVEKRRGWQIGTGIGAAVTVAVVAFIFLLLRSLRSDTGSGGEGGRSSSGESG